MLFSSTIFLFAFFPVVFIVYYAISFSRMLQNIWLFAASLVFYAWGEPVYVLLMLAAILVNWFAGLWVEHFRERPRAKKNCSGIGMYCKPECSGRVQVWGIPGAQYQ